MMNKNEWRCSECNAVLGFLDGSDILRIKYKDLYFFVFSLTGASQVKCLCRRCGKVNVIMVKATKAQHKDQEFIELEKFM